MIMMRFGPDLSAPFPFVRICLRELHAKFVFAIAPYWRRRAKSTRFLECINLRRRWLSCSYGLCVFYQVYKHVKINHHRLSHVNRVVVNHIHCLYLRTTHTRTHFRKEHPIMIQVDVPLVLSGVRDQGARLLFTYDGVLCAPFFVWAQSQYMPTVFLCEWCVVFSSSTSDLYFIFSKCVSPSLLFGNA